MDEVENLFENENYEVVIVHLPIELAVRAHGAQHTSVYAVRNRETGVDEAYTPSFPDAIAAAEQFSLAIENSVWKWVRIQAEADAMEEEDSAADPLH